MTSANAMAIRSTSDSSDTRMSDRGSISPMRSSTRPSVSSWTSPSRARSTAMSTISGSYQVPRRSRRVWTAWYGPIADTNTSRAAATAMIRANGGMASPRRPSGRPRPSQCSWTADTAVETDPSNPAFSAICAPRSQRVCSIARRSLEPFAARWTRRRTRSGIGSAVDMARRLSTAIAAVDRPAVDCMRFSARSSPPKMLVSAAAFEEQPASFSNAA